MLHVCQPQDHHLTVHSYLPVLVTVAVVVGNVKHLMLFHHLILHVTLKELLSLKGSVRRSWNHQSAVESFVVKEEYVHQRPLVR